MYQATKHASRLVLLKNLKNQIRNSLPQDQIESDDIDDVTYVAEDDSWSDWGEKKRSFLKSIDDL